MRLRLATRFSWTILGIVALALVSSLVAWYGAWRVNRRLAEAAREDQPGVRPEEVDITLGEQNSLLARFLLDGGNPTWEKQLRALRPWLQEWLAKVKDTTYVSDDEQALLVNLEQQWNQIATRQDEALALFHNGKVDEANTIWVKELAGPLTSSVHDLCTQLVDVNNRAVQYSMDRAVRRVQSTTWIVGVSGLLSLLLSGLLIWLFFARVLKPLRGMVADARLFRGDRAAGLHDSDEDELRIMGGHLRNLMSDVSDTRSRLERSGDQLRAAEKLASVGRLAASVAHEIRNPLTAMKMWLFSIRESVHGDGELDRKFQIVSEETGRLEAIVRNFLEFSRPVMLRRQSQGIAAIINQTLELLQPRLNEARIHVETHIPEDLPPVSVDAAQFKQVLLNLLGNAADTMPAGGRIDIATTTEIDAGGQMMAVVRIRDSGTGIPTEAQHRIFEPFFTTKDTGTGLGLCIAAQVMARHGGALVLESSSGEGTTFAVWTPLAEENIRGQDPHR
jgi:signal transduction histidine kinase